MKMKKTIIVICCVIIASMGIALTGCGNILDKINADRNSGESRSDKDVENSSDKDTDNSGDKDVDNSDDRDVDSSDDKDIDSSDKDSDSSDKDSDSVDKDSDSSDKDSDNSSDKDSDSSNKDSDSSNKDSDSSNKDSDSSNDIDAESTYVGTWVATVAEYEGIEYDASEMNAAFELILNADGTGTFDPGDGKGDIEWESAKDGVKVADHVSDSNFTYKDGKLLWELQIDKEFATIYFEKK